MKKCDADSIVSIGTEYTLLRFIVPVYQNYPVFSFECSCVDTLFKIDWQIFPVFWPFNDDIERPSLSSEELCHKVLFAPRTIFVNGFV